MSVSNYLPALQDLLQNIQNITPASSSSSTQQQAALQTIANTGVAENSSFQNLIASSAQSRIDKYIDLSHRLVDYNEIYNTNKYVQGELATETNRMGNLKNNLKNKIFISKQKSMGYRYEKSKTKFLMNLFLFSVFVFIILIALTSAQLAGSLTLTTFYIIVATIVVVYILIILLYISSNAYRTHSDWEKYHFSSMNKDKNSGQCK